MCSHGYFYQGNEKQTRATLKGHCLKQCSQVLYWGW